MWSSEWRRWERDPNCGKSPRPNLPEMELSESRRPAEILEENNFKDPLIKPLCPKRGKVISNYYSAEFEGFSLEVLHDFLSTTERLSPSPAPTEGRGSIPSYDAVRTPNLGTPGCPGGGVCPLLRTGRSTQPALPWREAPLPAVRRYLLTCGCSGFLVCPGLVIFFFFPSSLPRIRALRKYFA